MKKLAEWFINLYALWIIMSFAVGFFFPEAFLWTTAGKMTTWALAVVMLSMGLTFKVEDFRAIFTMPGTVLVAAISQYTIMPALGFTIAHLMHLPVEFAVGLILVACCPGGTASNMIAYIGKANLALSVISTAVSTILGIFMTPLLCKLLAGQMVPVDGWGMFLSVIELVLIPVSLGVFINWKFPHFVERLGKTGPVLSTLAIIVISIGVIVPSALDGREELLANAGKLVLAATLLHGFGFLWAYWFGRLCKCGHPVSKAIACETGMQNGGGLPQCWPRTISPRTCRS